MSEKLTAAQWLAEMYGRDSHAIFTKLAEVAIKFPNVFANLLNGDIVTYRSGDTDWQEHARAGRKIEAIKSLRQMLSVDPTVCAGLKEAKDMVEAWTAIYCRY